MDQNKKQGKNQTGKNGNHAILTEKEQLFVASYLLHFNATRAAREAGYGEKNIAVKAHELKHKRKIRAAIDARMRELIAEKQELLAQTLQEYKALAFSNISDYLSYNNDSIKLLESSDVDTRAIQSIEQQPIVTKSGQVADRVIKIKLHDKVRGLEGLAKYLGMFQNEEVSSEIHIHIDEQDARAVRNKNSTTAASNRFNE